MTYFHLGMGGPDGAHPNLWQGYRPTGFGYGPYVDVFGRPYDPYQNVAGPNSNRRRQPEDDMLNAKKVKIDCDELTATVEQMRRLGAAYLEHAHKTLRNIHGEFRDAICEDLWDEAMLPLRSFNNFAAKYAPSVKPIEGLERDAGAIGGSVVASSTIGGARTCRKRAC